MDLGPALITRADRSARETPEERPTEMTLCTAAGPLGCWYVHLKFAGSIHHCACTSMVCSASARCESALVAQTRRFLLRRLAVEKVGTHRPGLGTFLGVLRPFPANLAALSLVFTLSYVLCLLFNKRTL